MLPVGRALLPEPDRLRLGSRESPLALAQTRMVAAALQAAWPNLQCDIKTFKTQGDLILDRALSKAGDKGLFVKELETALLTNEIDLAVHSMKDMPGLLPEELALVSALDREDPRDVLLSNHGLAFMDLPEGAVIGTSSLRREAQLRRLRPDLHYRVIRGNLQTRTRKLEEGQYDAIVLAAAGVHRLGWQERITQYFDPWTETIPAVAQGILGLEYRKTDCRTLDYLESLEKKPVDIARLAERAVLLTLAGGCQLPLGAYCREHEGHYDMKGIVLSVDGSRCIVVEKRVNPGNPTESGRELAEELLARGGREILDEINAANKPPVDSP